MRIINNIIADFLYSVALKELGHGLHAIQDIEAHTPDYTQKFPIPGIEIYHHFDFPEADVAFTHKGEPDPRMLEAGVQSINYLGGFWEGVN
ncbi:MAG: hypothetical protein PHV61_10775 [Limnochordia bacterium]|nr:hypothetical protein [Limnochordia bacterium]